MMVSIVEKTFYFDLTNGIQQYMQFVYMYVVG